MMTSRYISIELAALALVVLTQVICSQSLMIKRASANDVDMGASSKLESFDSSDSPSSYEPETTKTSDDIIDELQEAVITQCLKQQHRYRECFFQYMRALINHIAEPAGQSKVEMMKRSGGGGSENKNEILSILRHAIAKNIKLKSNIKTTRF